MERWLIALALAAASPAAAQVAIANPEAPPNPIPDEQSLALGDAQARLTVPVSIGGRGPWPFIIDTGAERTVVSRELAGVLGLPAAPSRRIVTMSGIAVRDSVVVARLGLGRTQRRDIAAPLLQAYDLGALGMLGVDSLQDNRVVIDFPNATMTLEPAVRRRPPPPRPDEIVVTARSLFGRLIVTDAHWRGRRIAVIVDTGTAMSIGNPALLALVRPRARSLGPVTGISAIGQPLPLDVYAISDVQVGGITFNDVPVGFADGPAFHRLGLVERPALLLGTDALRLFRTVRIDFANREIRFGVRGSDTP